MIEIEVKDASIRNLRISWPERTAPADRVTLPVSKDLQRYFRGEPVDFSEYEVDLTDLTGFQQDVLTAARRIPWGRTVTYSQLAIMAGRPAAVRAAGSTLAKNRVPVIIPCHRVVAKHGLGGFSCGTGLKRSLLRLESVLF